MIRRNYVVWSVALIVLIAVGRVLVTYRVTSPAFDETCHVAAAIELLDHHTYALDPVHPPLSRLAIGLPLYLAGVRFPKLAADAPGQDNYNVMGNHILYDDGHFLWKLFLARSVMLPFLALLSTVVFLWTRREFGETAGFFSLALFTTLPMILALSSIAYSDLPAATMQFGALLALTMWLKKPTRAMCLLFAIAAALAVLTKFTSVLFISSSAVLVVLGRW